jgi:splicing factor 3A subunit 2
MALYRDVGSKPGSGGVLSQSQQNVQKKERLRKLALDQVDLTNDPYFMRNHLGSYECRLCLTLHNNEGNYLAHTQGKRHQLNLKRRQMKLEKQNPTNSTTPVIQNKAVVQKKVIKIGRPGYNVAKIVDPVTGQRCLLFQIMYPEITHGIQPLYRFMSAYEQKIDLPYDRNFQYLLFAAEPYENIGFKIPNLPIDKGPGKFETNWNKETNVFILKLNFLEKESTMLPQPPPPRDLE